VLGVVLAGVMLGVLLGGFVGVVRGMQAVRMRHMGVMTGPFVLAAVIVLGRLAVMVRRTLMVLGRGFMMLAAVMGLRAHWVHPVVGSGIGVNAARS
jgi:hypothetical protein